ncbi:hypothetical protein [Amycolatopsis sp. GA6-003]|uniref:hypothetical protein n=1 Tax=Amycolatopsis sp. GA6-003 TaxID=2652444 RepID=UPI003916D392
MPVAIVLEHRADPFGVHKLLRAVLRFLGDCAIPVLVLRGDISALGLPATVRTRLRWAREARCDTYIRRVTEDPLPRDIPGQPTTGAVRPRTHASTPVRARRSGA